MIEIDKWQFDYKFPPLFTGWLFESSRTSIIAVIFIAIVFLKNKVFAIQMSITH